MLRYPLMNESRFSVCAVTVQGGGHELQKQNPEAAADLRGYQYHLVDSLRHLEYLSWGDSRATVCAAHPHAEVARREIEEEGSVFRS